ncbi:Rmf/CrpP fold protein [Micromonospora echinospora]
MSTDLPPSQDQRDRAARHGRLAGRARRPATDCPYPPGGTPTEKVLAAVWIRAYLKANPEAANRVNLNG